MSAPEIVRMMELALVHLQPATLNHWLPSKLPSNLILSRDYGYLVYAGTHLSDADGVPADLVECMAFTRRYGCQWVNFDCDVDPIEGLTVYEHD